MNDSESDDEPQSPSTSQGPSTAVRLSKAEKKANKRKAIQEKYAAQKEEAKRAKAEKAQSCPAPLTPTVPTSPSTAARRAEIREMVCSDLDMKISAGGLCVVIDCDERHLPLMTDQEVTSLCQQLNFCYGLNKRSVVPVSILTTGLTQAMQAQLSKISGLDKWQGVTFTETSFPEVLASFAHTPADGRAVSWVYLSADADESLDLNALKWGNASDRTSNYLVIVVGGLVDRNRFKLASLSRAESVGIPAMRLPLEGASGHLGLFGMRTMDGGKAAASDNTGKNILTVNQVFGEVLTLASLANLNLPARGTFPMP